MTTIAAALADAKRRIAPVSLSSALDAQLLLAEVLAVSRAHVLAHPEKALTAEQTAAYESAVLRLEKGEPVAYILGHRAFYDREFIVSSAVLIPRPETELLLEEAIHDAKDVGVTHASPLQNSPFIAVDVGTGSGALAITFAAHLPTTTVYATDISPDALQIAQKNADAQQVKVVFLQGDLLMPLIERGLKVDLVMANLPYIAQDEVLTLDVSRYEPILALDGGADGLDLVRRLLAQIPVVVNPDTLVLLEIGAGQGAAALDAVNRSLSPKTAAIIKDYAGHDRIVRIQL